MSLPTRARYYDKQGRLIFSYGSNIGCFLNTESFINCVEELPRVYKAHFIELYGVKFAASWLALTPTHRKWLAEIFEFVHFKPRKLPLPYEFQQRIDAQKIAALARQNQLSNDYQSVIIPMIRNAMPNIIAQELIGVQPMVNKASLAFSIRAHYRTTNKYVVKLKHWWWQAKVYTKSVWWYHTHPYQKA